MSYCISSVSYTFEMASATFKTPWLCWFIFFSENLPEDVSGVRMGSMHKETKAENLVQLPLIVRIMWYT